MARRFYVFSVIVLCQASRKIQLKEKKKKLKSKGILSGVFVLSRTTTCANPVNCLIDPCQGATRRNYTNAVCRANYCGGCNRNFYVGCKKVDCG
ncbi:unnamed protein product [Adineta ricciae]|uniref:Uncharacterized protein n=1 Tax=Adineta ricciae TaxID=249248 RepID=A0A814XH15_ADIRI|nr:unnamed protein product [Adineta ricciae]